MKGLWVFAATLALWPTFAAEWTAAERATIENLWIGRLPPLTPARFPSNPVMLDPRAAELGRKIFSDATLSRSGDLSCARCHAADLAFSSAANLALPEHGPRQAPSLVGVAWQNWFFWDGRKDSLWSQALAPLESTAEYGLTRTEAVRRVQRRYGAELRALFGAAAVPRDLAFVRIGQVLAAYTGTLIPTPAAFDRYVERTFGRKASPGGVAADAPFPACAERGLGLFVGKARCANCHFGPRLENDSFHNTGVPSTDDLDQPGGRYHGMGQARADAFSCRSPSARRAAGRPLACAELDHLPTDSTFFMGAFKTPSLRNVALTAPYMHGGQFATLEEVVRHYVRAPSGSVGVSELSPVPLTAEEQNALVCFLKTL